jgi:hypothetical protein
MCYRVFFHTLSCDVRPVVSDGKEFFVDSFASPMKCSCEQQSNVLPLRPCEEHKCCMVMDEMRPCLWAESCEILTNVHRYYQTGPEFANYQQEVQTWPSMTTIDYHLFPNGLPQFSELGGTLRESLCRVVEIGRDIMESWDVLSRLSYSASMLRSVQSVRYSSGGYRSPFRSPNTDLDLLAAMEGRVLRADDALRRQVQAFRSKRWLVRLHGAHPMWSSSNLQSQSIPEVAEADDEMDMEMGMLLNSISVDGVQMGV